MTKITTLLPTFQRAKLLPRAIESVLNQTYQDFILAIYDNHSQDETFEIVRNYQKKDARIHYYRHPINKGPFENFVTALSSVQTPFFSFLSDDDYLLPCFYCTNLKGFEEYPEIGFSASRTLIVNAKNKLLHEQFFYPFFSGFFRAGEGAAALLQSRWLPIWTSVLFKTEHVQKIGGLDKDAGYAFDMDFLLRYASSTPSLIVSKPTAVLMNWEGAGSTLYATIHPSNYDAMICNVKKTFAGTLDECQQVIDRLQTLKIRGLKHTWVYALLSNDLSTAKQAKKAFLHLGGREKKWKLVLLYLAESNYIMRKFLGCCIYLKKLIRQLIGACLKRIT